MTLKSDLNFRKFLECNTSISLDCADGWKSCHSDWHILLGSKISNSREFITPDVNFSIDLSTFILDYSSVHLSEAFWNLIYPRPGLYEINVKSNFPGVDYSFMPKYSFQTWYTMLFKFNLAHFPHMFPETSIRKSVR